MRRRIQAILLRHRPQILTIDTGGSRRRRKIATVRDQQLHDIVPLEFCDRIQLQIAKRS